MYAGAIGPTIIQLALFCIWVFILSIVSPKDVPALPLEARTLHGWALWKKCLRGIIPSLGLIFLVLGTIFMGLATPTEAGAMGVVGALLLAMFYGTLTWDLLYQGMASTMRLTAMVVYILIGSRVFSLVFQGVGGKVWIEELLIALPGGQVGFLIFVNAFVFVIAFFLDFFEIAFIIIPLLAPVADKLGIDLIWFGVLICANIQTSFMHPPFGFALVLSARHSAAVDQDLGYLLGSDPMGVPAGDPRGDSDFLAGIGDLLARRRSQGGPVNHQHRNPAAGSAAARSRAPKNSIVSQHKKRPEVFASGRISAD